MKYKVGDKVRVKFKDHWNEDAKRDVERLPNRIAIIKSVHTGGDYEYFMEGMHWGWHGYEIEELIEDTEVTRFELMEL